MVDILQKTTTGNQFTTKLTRDFHTMNTGRYLVCPVSNPALNIMRYWVLSLSGEDVCVLCMRCIHESYFSASAPDV